ncbi:MAG TPA: hypothetical protein VF290_22365 [Pyrinomonadaceae bacterium]
MSITLSLVLLLSISAHAQQPESKGELRIYHRATQIGTVANREFKDDKGRVVKVIYYTGPDLDTSNLREEQLRVQSSRTTEYDEYDCPIKSQTYDQNGKLTHIEELLCAEGTATRRLRIARSPQGIKRGEFRHTATGSAQTGLEFDSNGEKVIAITGQLPSDTDLVHGWGDVLHGFALGIAANREKGPQQDVRVHVSLKNTGNEAGQVMVSPVLVELKNSNGQVIEPKPQYRINSNQTGFNHCPSYLQMAGPARGRAQSQYGYGLGEQYERLSPGKYSITVSYCVQGQSERLVSNTIEIEIE